MDLYTDINVLVRVKQPAPIVFSHRGVNHEFQDGRSLRDAIHRNTWTTGKVMVTPAYLARFDEFGDGVFLSKCLAAGRFRYNVCGSYEGTRENFAAIFENSENDVELIFNLKNYVTIVTNNTTHIFKADLLLSECEKTVFVTIADL